MITRVSYDRWFLNNLENVQQTLNNRQAAQQQKTAEEADLYRRYDTVEFSEDAYQAAEAAQTAKTATLPEQTSLSATETDDFDLMSLIAVSTAEKGDNTDDFHVGLLDLIESGSIEYEEIKPVKRNVSKVYDDDAAENAHALTTLPEETDISEAPQPDDSGSIKLSEPISRKVSRPDYGEKQTEDKTYHESANTEQKLTAAQQKGVETYQRVQSYTNPYTMSLNMAYSVA